MLINLAMFVVGHLGQALTISFFAGVGGIPISLDDIQSISVLQSFSAIWKGGGIPLAILILIVSIMWPYVKILSMLSAWFVPTRILGIHKRGTFIKRLDQLGKWSFIELILLVLILVIFDIEIHSPDRQYLPYDFYFLKVVVDAKTSTYAFASALILSLVTNNVLSWYQTHILMESVSALRPDRPDDSEKMCLATFEFNKDVIKRRIPKYLSVLIVMGAILGITGIILGLFQKVIRTDVLGLLSLVYRTSSIESSDLYSIANILSGMFTVKSTIGLIILGVFITTIIVVVPIVQLILLVVMFLGRFTLKRAYQLYEFNTLLSSWVTNEVFLVGSALTIVELGQVSSSLTQNECKFLQPILAVWLLPTGLISENDVAASCLAIVGEFRLGVAFLLGTITIINIVYYFVCIMFSRYIEQRLGIHELERVFRKPSLFSKFSCSRK